MQAPMKEMVGAGDDDDRQFERFRPSQYVCQRNGGIGGAMNDQRVFRDRTRGVLTGSLNVAGSRASAAALAAWAGRFMLAR